MVAKDNQNSINLSNFIQKACDKKLAESKELVNEIIEQKFQGEKIISKVFDKMLMIINISDESMNLFYKFVDYTRSFNRELADMYENKFIKFCEIYK